MANKADIKETAPSFPFDAHFYPNWLLEHTDNLIDSDQPEVQEAGYELLDLYDVFGDEVKELVLIDAEQQTIVIDPNQLILDCFR